MSQQTRSGIEGTRYYDWTGGAVITISGTSAASSALQHKEVLLSSTTNCWITMGTAPTAVAATANNLYLPAGVLFPLRISAGDKIAVIQASAGGTLSILPAM